MKNNCLNFCDHLNEYANYSESDSIHNRKSSQALFQKVSKGYTKKVPKLAIQHHHICWEFYMDQPHGERNQALILLDVANKSKNESNTDVCKDSEEEI